MRILFTILLAGFVAFTFVSWFVWAFWITGTPKKPNLFAGTFHFWSVYRTGIQGARSRGCPAWIIRIFEWSHGAAVLCFIVVMFLLILRGLKG